MNDLIKANSLAEFIGSGREGKGGFGLKIPVERNMLNHLLLFKRARAVSITEKLKLVVETRGPRSLFRGGMLVNYCLLITK